ncbi:hypothetical protein [Glaciecola sp. KUL10]|uniref:hypothetical protein n=1 Tax=Glaciecola sp. (strain KUL10) TaxID=2161813 RepID=UPI000D7861ED|nr:hypothetical protein [Glaciecola sp. KUL10]GBL02941.1 hypothetical protein KUL10_02140 [Glaciecola sp. KUL10]
MDLNEQAKQIEFADLVGASQQSISKYVRAGILNKGETYRTWFAKYCEKLRTEAAGREISASRQTLEQAKTREAIANAQLKELDLYREHKLVLDAQQVREAMEQWVTVAKSEYENSIEKIIALIEDKYGVSIDRESINGTIESTCRTIGDFRVKS